MSISSGGQAAVPARAPHAPVTASIASFLPYVLAVMFALLGLRGVADNEMADPDAARHAMNGVLVHDFIQDGPLQNPVSYGKAYYSRLPAVSMPYHPPLFPVFESLFYFGVGVNFLAARLAIAGSTALAVFLMYRLVLATHGSHLLAFSATATFFSWKWAQWLASDIMLEVPALVFVLASLFFVRDLSREYPLRSGVAFAVLAGAAVWTKQQAVFLGLVPFASVLLSRNLRLLRSKTIWISSALFGLFVFLLATLSLPFSGTGVKEVPSSSRITHALTHHSRFYIDSIAGELGAAALLIPVAIVFLLAARRFRPKATRTELYIAWAGSAFLLLIVIRPFDSRYLFFLGPALVVAVYEALRLTARWLFGSRTAQVVLAAITAAVVAANLRVPIPFMHGPREAAVAVMKNAPARVLYCGRTNGNFIFAVRSLDPDRHTVVMRGDKLAPSTFAPDQFETFGYRYGLDYVVLERTSIPRPWYGIAVTPTRSMALETAIPLTASDPLANGQLRVYRFTNRSPNPESILTLHISKIGGDIHAEF